MVLTPYITGCSEFDKMQSFKIARMRLPPTSFLKLFFMIVYLIWYTQRYYISKIFATDWYPAGLATLAISKIFRIRYYVATYALEVILPQKSVIRKKLMDLTLRSASKVIAVSKYTRDILVKIGVLREKIVIVPCGVDSRVFNPNLDCSDVIKKHDLQNKKVILTVAALRYPHKGQDLVIKSLPKVIEKVPNVRYLVVGDGPLGARFKKLANDMKLRKYVIFAGRVSDAELPKYYVASDVFVMPSGGDEKKGEVEGFGIAYVEANACGKPTIGLKIGGVEDAILNGKTGILINERSTEELSSAIIRVLMGKKLAKRLGANGRARVEKELNWEDVTKKIKVLLQE